MYDLIFYVIIFFRIIWRPEYWNWPQGGHLWWSPMKHWLVWVLLRSIPQVKINLTHGKSRRGYIIFQQLKVLLFSIWLNIIFTRLVLLLSHLYSTCSKGNIHKFNHFYLILLSFTHFYSILLIFTQSYSLLLNLTHFNSTYLFSGRELILKQKRGKSMEFSELLNLAPMY